jgi:A/G-specific adenine glycosylase
MDTNSFNAIDQVQKQILTFYAQHKRDLPWRKTTDPYKILLSEFMLQQTQVSRVITYYTKWINRWPTLKDLSSTSFQDVLSEWIGLGYNRRARHLHETSKIIIERYNGDILSAMHEYQDLPGIGEYTSRAVRIFAGNEDIATVDTNIRRIFIHLFNLPTTVSDQTLYEIADRCVPKGKSCIWHNALMDYGAMKLTARKTGIKPKTTQSPFQGSDRQIRGRLKR